MKRAAAPIRGAAKKPFLGRVSKESGSHEFAIPWLIADLVDKIFSREDCRARAMRWVDAQAELAVVVSVSRLRTLAQEMRSLLEATTRASDLRRVFSKYFATLVSMYRVGQFPRAMADAKEAQSLLLALEEVATALETRQQDDPKGNACDSAPRYPGVARDLCRGCYGDVKSLYGGPGVVSSQASNQCAGKTLLQHCFNIVSALFQHCFRIVNIVSTLLQYFNNVVFLGHHHVAQKPRNLHIVHAPWVFTTF